MSARLKFQKTVMLIFTNLRISNPERQVAMASANWEANIVASFFSNLVISLQKTLG
jgi:hypothetical protein